jgi:beta-glucosidase
MRRCFGLAGALLLSTAASACTKDPDPEPSRALPASTGVLPALEAEALQAGNLGLRCGDASLDARVAALLARMSVAQKIHEMHGDDRHIAARSAIDGFYFAGGDAALGIPHFKMVDGPRGVRTGESVASEGTATAFPVAMARGATWDPELERRVGSAIGREVAAKGGNVLLAPTINLLRHPGWGRAQETYSEDPEHMSQMASAFIAGAQRHVVATVKHFAANSIENTRFAMSANMDERTLREVYLPHFRRAVQEAHVASVMTAYNRVNGTYAAEHAQLLRQILKGDWGFSGFVMSDWIAGTRSTVPSAQAGLDMEMPVGVYYGQPLRDAVASGALQESVLDDAVRRILRIKLCFGLDAPATDDASAVESAEHVALAREASEKSIVLLKNADAVLPLTPSRLRSIAVIGELSAQANLGDRGSSSVVPSYAVSPLAGIQAAAPDVELIAIPTNQPTAEELARLSGADVAIVVAGLTYAEEGEFIPITQQSPGRARGGDRADLDLPALHERLIADVAAHAKRTVVVLEAGSAVTVRDWVDSVDALVMAWYPGMEGGTALGRVLFGEVNPSGKLPVTFPRALQDLPPWDIVATEVAYGYFHGYRLLAERGLAPEFPFGFGLSYTAFALGRLALEREIVARDDTLRVRVDVGNLGERRGDEVVQLYVSYPASAAQRPLHELKAFRRVGLDPGQVTTVELKLRVSDLAFWDASSSGWVVQAGDYVLMAGNSSGDLPLRASFRVE